MALTTTSFVPENRKSGSGGGGGSSAAHSGSPMHGTDAAYNHATDAAMTAAHESMHTQHPVSGTGLPQGTGAGQGTVRKGGRGGK